MKGDAKQTGGDKSQDEETAVIKPDKARQTIEIVNKSGYETSKEMQEELNQPQVSPEEMDKEDQEFLKIVVDKIESKEIDLHSTGTLINDSVYEGLEATVKSQVEIDALNLLTTLRSIYKMYSAKQTDTYQFKNMLHNFRLTKERIEEEDGDVYII